MASELSVQYAVPLNEMHQMAHAMAASGFFGFKTPDQALAIMLIAQANGQHPASAAQDYDVIQGRPAKRPQAMLRDFLSAGGRVEWHEYTDDAAEATFAHPRGGSIRVRWDMQRAQRMGLASKDNYKRQPGVMFRWRCVAEGIRIVYPGATAGLYTPEEATDEDTSSDDAMVRQESRPQRPEYSQESFEKNFISWSKLVEDGKKTPAQIIAMIESKATLSHEHRAAIERLAPSQSRNDEGDAA